MSIKEEAGFTLLEILAVVAIIGILAAFITPKLAANVTEARENVCNLNMKYLEGILERYRLAKDKYPENLNDLNLFYQDEYPVCPKEDFADDSKKTGYYFNNKGQVNTNGGAGWTEIFNESAPE